MPRDNHTVTSTSSMSLEKEPAGAFNKAQRLIEWGEYTRYCIFYKKAGRFVFGGNGSKRSAGGRDGFIRLTSRK